jgi:competence protein ComEA
MMPVIDRGLFGWSAESRALLILTAAILGIVQAWISEDVSGRELALPALSVEANSAPIAVLEALPGLGPVLAGRIVEAREVQPFRSMDDLDRRVRGIGPAKVAALLPYLRFDVVQLSSTPSPRP